MTESSKLNVNKVERMKLFNKELKVDDIFIYF